MTPEYSPRMLRLFLHARCLHAADGLTGGARFDALKRAKTRLRKSAGVSNFEFDFAWMGRLHSAAARAKLWGACGVVPGDYGITLTDDGGQQ